MSCQCYSGSVSNNNPFLPDSKMCKVHSEAGCGLPMMMGASYCSNIKNKQSCENAKYEWGVETCSKSCRWIPPPTPKPSPTPKLNCSKKPYPAGCPCFHSWDCDESKIQMMCAPKGNQAAVCQRKPAMFLHPF